MLREPAYLATGMMVEPWETAFVPVSAAGQRFLDLTPQTTPEALATRLKNWGIGQPGRPAQYHAVWDATTQKIVLTALPQEAGRLLELLALIDRGYLAAQDETQTPRGRAPASSQAADQ